MKDDVYFNEGIEPIFIITKSVPDRNGGPAFWTIDRETNYMIAPGTGIDVTVLGLKKRESTSD